MTTEAINQVQPTMITSWELHEGPTCDYCHGDNVCMDCDGTGELAGEVLCETCAGGRGCTFCVGGLQQWIHCELTGGNRWSVVFYAAEVHALLDSGQWPAWLTDAHIQSRLDARRRA